VRVRVRRRVRRRVGLRVRLRVRLRLRVDHHSPRSSCQARATPNPRDPLNPEP